MPINLPKYNINNYKNYSLHEARLSHAVSQSPAQQERELLNQEAARMNRSLEVQEQHLRPVADLDKEILLNYQTINKRKLERRDFQKTSVIVDIVRLAKESQIQDGDMLELYNRIHDPQYAKFYDLLISKYQDRPPNLTDDTEKKDYDDFIMRLNKANIAVPVTPTTSTEEYVQSYFQHLNLVSIKLERSFQHVNIAESIADIQNDTQPELIKAGQKVLKRYKRALGKIPPEASLVVLGIGIIAAMSKKYREFGAGLILMTGMGELLNATELPHPERTASKLYQDVYNKAASFSKRTNRQRAVNMLEGMSTTTMGAVSFQEYWDSYQKVKGGRSRGDFKKFIESKLDSGSLSEQDKASLEMEHYLIPSKRKLDATMAMMTFDNRFGPLLEALSPAERAKLMETPFYQVVTQLTRLAEARKLDDVSQSSVDAAVNMLESGAVVASRKLGEELDKGLEQIDEGSSLSDAIEAIGIPEAKYTAGKFRNVQIYGVKFQISNWVSGQTPASTANGTPTLNYTLAREKDIQGAELIYYDANGQAQTTVIWFKESGIGNTETSQSMQNYAKDIIGKEITDTNTASGLNSATAQISPNISFNQAKNCWEGSFEGGQYLSVDNISRSLILSTQDHFGDPNNPYSLRFGEIGSDEIHSTIADYAEDIYEQELAKDMSSVFGVHERHIDISPNQIFRGANFMPANAGTNTQLNVMLKIDDFGKVPAVAEYNPTSKEWSYQLTPSYYEDYLDLQFEQFRQEIYEVNNGVLGIPIPDFASKYWAEHLADSLGDTQASTWESVLLVIEESVVEKMNGMATDAEKMAYIQKTSKSLGEVLKVVKKHQEDKTEIPPHIFDGLTGDLEQMDFLPQYNQYADDLMQDLTDLNFDQKTKLAIYLQYRRDIEKELDGHHSEAEASKYADYVANKYTDVFSFEYETFRNYDDYQKNKKRFILGGDHIPDYATFNNNNAKVRRREFDQSGHQIDYGYSARQEYACIKAEEEFIKEQNIEDLMLYPRLLTKAALLRVRAQYLNTLRAGANMVTSEVYKDYLKDTIHIGNLSSLQNASEMLENISIGSENLLDYVKTQGLTGLIALAGQKIGEIIGALIGAILNGTGYMLKEAFVRTFFGPDDWEAFQKSNAVPVAPKGKPGVIPNANQPNQSTASYPFIVMPIDELKRNNLSYDNFSKPNQRQIDANPLWKQRSGDVVLYEDTSQSPPTNEAVIYLGPTVTTHALIQMKDGTVKEVRQSTLSKAIGQQPLLNFRNLIPGNIMTIAVNDGLEFTGIDATWRKKAIDVEITGISENISSNKVTINYRHLQRQTGQAYPETGEITIDISGSNEDLEEVVQLYPRGTSRELFELKSQIPNVVTQTAATNPKTFYIYDFNYDWEVRANTFNIDQSKEQMFDYLYVLDKTNIHQVKQGNPPEAEIRISKTSPKELEVRKINPNSPNQLMPNWQKIPVASLSTWLDSL